MLELNRLKPMPQNYDVQLFNRLYLKTENLRNKLARGINPDRFGLAYEDVLAMFDVKFIFTFSKHHEEPEEKLKAFLLNSLANFRCRILRAAYTKKFSQNIESMEDVLTIEDHLEPETEDIQGNVYKDKLMDYMKEHLSSNAYVVLGIKLNPPPYILHKVNTSIDANLQKIPDHLILDYLDLGFTENSYKYLDSIKKEIKNAITHAKNHFQSAALN